MPYTRQQAPRKGQRSGGSGSRDAYGGGTGGSANTPPGSVAPGVAYGSRSNGPPTAVTETKVSELQGGRSLYNCKCKIMLSATKHAMLR